MDMTEEIIEFIEKHPFDEETFYTMLNQRSKVLSGEKDIKTGSEEISTKFFNKYHPDLK